MDIAGATPTSFSTVHLSVLLERTKKEIAHTGFSLGVNMTRTLRRPKPFTKTDFMRRMHQTHQQIINSIITGTSVQAGDPEDNECNELKASAFIRRTELRNIEKLRVDLASENIVESWLFMMATLFNLLSVLSPQ